jgi:cell division protein FtsW
MGGSSLFFTCFSIGIILSVARNVEQVEGAGLALASQQAEEILPQNNEEDENGK